MKKETILFCLALIILISCAKQETPSSSVQQTMPEEASKENVAEEIKENITAEEHVKPEPAAEEKSKYQIFDPLLTYEGAYNGPLYGTSEQVGSASMDTYFQNLDRNGINFFIGMFGIEGEPNADLLVSDNGLGEVIDAVQKHPYRVIPFFNPGIGGEDAEQYLGDTLTGWYSKTLAASKMIAGDDFIRGFGEIETQEWGVQHDNPKVLQLINLAQRNNINFMFHPVASGMDDVERIVKAYPDTTFLIHMYREDLDQSMSNLIRILKENNNLYFSMDAAHIIHVKGMDIIYDYDSGDTARSVADFIDTLNSKEKSIIDSAISTYKPLVDAVPDKVMWGTEIGPEYAFEKEVFDRAIKVSRFVIAGFKKEHQEAVGYKNALRMFGEGVTVSSDIKVIDTRSWPDCDDDQMSDCNESCGIPDTDTETPEQGACYQKCLNGKKCKDVPEVD